jgi:uncharacterized protein (DUF362 family)
MGTPNRKPTVDRKDFLRLVATMGLAAALPSFLEACSNPGLNTPTSAPTDIPTQISPSLTLKPTSTASPTIEPSAAATGTLEPTATTTAVPTAISENELAQVTFVKTSDRAAGVHKAIDLLGRNPVNSKSVFIKPNFNSADPTPGSTHPDVLRATITKLREMGAQGITLGDRSGMGTTSRVMQDLGVIAMGAELGFEVIDFTKLSADDWVMMKSLDSHWQAGFPFPRLCLQAETIVQTCCLKTHQFGGHFTMSLKNSVGMVADSVAGYANNFMDELHNSMYQRKMIAEINTAYTPALIIMDGVEAFTAGGPHQGRLASPEVVLASSDRIAIDAVGVALLRHFKTTPAVASGPIFQQEQIARAVELGLGVDSPHKIELIPADSESAAFADQIQKILVADG